MQRLALGDTYRAERKPGLSFTVTGVGQDVLYEGICMLLGTLLLMT